MNPYERTEISFSREEAKAYLKTWGYTIKNMTVTYAHSVYHNDVEYEDVEREAVYWGSKMVGEPTQHEDPVTRIFQREFKQKLSNILK